MINWHVESWVVGRSCGAYVPPLITISATKLRRTEQFIGTKTATPVGRDI